MTKRKVDDLNRKKQMEEKNQKVLDRFVELLDDIEQDQDLINRVGCIIFLDENDEMVPFEWNGAAFCRMCLPIFKCKE